MASLARSSAARLLRSSNNIKPRATGPSRSIQPAAQASFLHTSSRLQNIKDKKITEEEARQIAATHHHGRAQQMSQNPPIDIMTGEVVMQADIDPSALVIEQTKSPKKMLPASQLQFGHSFTDHMLLIPWSHSTGWGTPTIKPYGPLNLDPSSTVLHYACTLFEGMKAYRDAESGRVSLFRPDKNMERMNNSAARLAFPTFTGDNLTQCIKKLVSLDKNWIPSEPGHSLYIRPTMIGTQAALGVGASTDVLLFVICSPVGPYYKTGFKPVSLLATTTDVRAWPGGTGGYKLGSNYAGGVVPQMAAATEGYQQILWLFGEDHQLTEVGTMNLFVVLEDAQGNTELVTPPLRDIILPGVTRDSVLSLAKEHASGKLNIEGLPKKFKVSERQLTMPQIHKLQKQGKLKEMFGTGTAAVVSPIKEIGYDGEKIPVPVGSDGLGDVARAMLREITGRQLGTIESEWSVVVE
ncbi:putative branched-chain-amino-acid aminotransferase 2 [Cystobasidium minutum MCA 4210]|uniref:putative branched-chain-amino-acid aminotransferase 2 n=1 Tax=Cystobasidium minutum MCA 4210 TaxID=1397322 RepID=UPI0034CECDDD|eukprot:jgi/Rhomi1/207360/estExt_Genemark1.C_1_t10253